jgi:hypothetical protein
MRFQTILDKKAGFESIPLETRKPTRGRNDFGGLEIHKTERDQIPALLHLVAGAVGIEPTTFGFGDRRSAN